MASIDLKQTEFFSMELTDLHQLVTTTAQQGSSTQNNVKDSDTFPLHMSDEYSHALKRIIVFIEAKSSNMLGEVIKIATIKAQEMNYETVVANIFIADVMLAFYLYNGWSDQLTDKLCDKIVQRLQAIGDDVHPMKNETNFDVAYSTMINQWSTLIRLLCQEKQFKSIWAYFFGYWKDPNTENFNTRVRLLRFLQFGKNEVADYKVVEGVLKTIAASVKSAKHIETKEELMELLENLMLSLPEGSFAKELNYVKGVISPFFNKSFKMECHGAKVEAIIHMKTNLGETQTVQKFMNQLNDINAKTEPILNYIETLCKGVIENDYLYLPDSFYNLPIAAKKRISPFRMRPLLKYAEKYIQIIMGVVVNCPVKVEKEEIERRSRKVVFCAAHSLPVTYHIIDSFLDDKEDNLSLAVLYNALHLIVNDKFLWVNVDEEKEAKAKKKVLSLGKRKFLDLYNSVYDKVKALDTPATSTRQLSIPQHIKEFMASNCADDTYIKATMFKAVKRWREIQSGKQVSLETSSIRQTENEVLKNLENWGNNVAVDGLTVGMNVVKRSIMSEIPDEMRMEKEEVKEKVVEKKRKKLIKEEKQKEKIPDEMILFVQLIRYISNDPKQYIIYTQKSGAFPFYPFVTSKTDYLATTIQESVLRMVFMSENFRTIIIWDLMKVFVDLMETDVPYQNMMEFVDAVMCLWTVKRINETTKHVDADEEKKKKSKKDKTTPTVIFTEHLSEHIEAIITVLQQRFDPNVRFETPELLTYLYFTSLKDFDNTVWKSTYKNEKFIEEYSRYLYILQTVKVPNTLVEIRQTLPTVSQTQLQVVNQHLLLLDYLQTSIILDLLGQSEATRPIIQRIMRISRKQLAKEGINDVTRFRLLNIYLSSLSLNKSNALSKQQQIALYSNDNTEFVKLGEEATLVLKNIIKEVMEKTEYQSVNEQSLIRLLSCMNIDIFYYFIEQIKVYALPLIISDKTTVERRRQLMMTTMLVLNGCLMRDCSHLFQSPLANRFILGILFFINEVFLQLKLLWPSYTPNDNYSYCAPQNFPAYFAQNFILLLFYFCRNIKKQQLLRLKEPTSSVLPVSMPIHFLVWPLEQRADICEYLINTFINNQMKTEGITDILCSSSVEAICAIFALAPLSFEQKFFMKPKRIVELEKYHGGVLKWIVRFHPDLVFSLSNPDIENMTQSTVIIKAISDVYAKVCAPDYIRSGVKQMDTEHIELLEATDEVEGDVDPAFIANLKKFGASLLHHCLITLMADEEDIRLCSFNVVLWLLPVKFGLSDKFDYKIFNEVVKHRIAITTSIEQNRFVAALEIVKLCIKHCEPHAKTVFYKGTMAGSGNKLTELQKRWLVTYSINWLPFVSLSKDFSEKEYTKILDILVYDVTSAMKHNSEQAITFWTKVCERQDGNENIIHDEKSNYNVIFTYLKSELPKGKNRDAFLIVFQALMKVNTTSTFLKLAQTMSFEYSANMMMSRGSYKDKYKAQYIAMNVLNDFFGETLFEDESGIHYVVLFSLLLCYASQDRNEVEIFYNFVRKLCYNFYDAFSSDKDATMAKCGQRFYTLISGLEIDRVLNREILIQIIINLVTLLGLQKKPKLISYFKKELANWACSGNPSAANVGASLNCCEFFVRIFNVGRNEIEADQFVFTLLKLKNALADNDDVVMTLQYKNVIADYCAKIMEISDMFLRYAPDVHLMLKVMWVVNCFMVSLDIPIGVYRRAIRMLNFSISPEIWDKVRPEDYLTALKDITNNNITVFKGFLVMAMRGLTDNDCKDVSAEIFAKLLSKPEMFFLHFPRKQELVVPIGIIAFTCWFCDKITNLKLRTQDDWDTPKKLLKILIQNTEKLKEVKLKDYLNYARELMEVDLKTITISTLLKKVLDCLAPLVTANFVTIVDVFFNECVLPETSPVFKDILIQFTMFFATRSELKSEFVRIVMKKRDLIKDNEYIFELFDIMVKCATEQEPVLDVTYMDSYTMLDAVALKMFGMTSESRSGDSYSKSSAGFSNSENASNLQSVSSLSSAGKKKRVLKVE
ncbi:hypothetical protein EIN_086110 [Entamoeba invadens IP1]|uniref:hypothetical protein n=1 Tax=Entamoeba invadens IP1 TaxID=370355 RepID=UPI0002C3F472|nr:hypothetical protein EIN_086110 [Entamoeba invadens IP1]ELP85359.1 hypothetical protein EIN_086110 [Entamoeba invadens IP1]|eukprot:XP_004184705.1 hypothetical protein EIN_086110 [Entamoeba invadens IP1]